MRCNDIFEQFYAQPRLLEDLQLYDWAIETSNTLPSLHKERSWRVRDACDNLRQIYDVTSESGTAGLFSQPDVINH